MLHNDYDGENDGLVAVSHTINIITSAVQQSGHSFGFIQEERAIQYSQRVLRSQLNQRGH